MGVNTENPPLAGMGNGKIIGIDVDIAAALADELGLKLSIVETGSDPAAALANNEADIILGIDNASAEGDFWMSPSYLPTGIALFALRQISVEPRCRRSPARRRCHLRRAGILEERLGRDQRVRRGGPHLH